MTICLHVETIIEKVSISVENLLTLMDGQVSTTTPNEFLYSPDNENGNIDWSLKLTLENSTNEDNYITYLQINNFTINTESSYLFRHKRPILEVCLIEYNVHGYLITNCFMNAKISNSVTIV